MIKLRKNVEDKKKRFIRHGPFQGSYYIRIQTNERIKINRTYFSPDRKKNPDKIAIMFTSRTTLQEMFLLFIFLAAIFGAIYKDYPLLSSYGADEDFDVMKPFLMDSGYSLYKDIWNDQPPVFSYILWAWLKIWGFSLPAARILITLFSSALLLALYSAVKMINGRKGAWFSMLCLILSPYFLQMSSIVLIGMPAMSLLMISYALAVYYEKQGTLFSFLGSLIFFVLAAGTKLMACLGLPFLIIIWIMGERNHGALKLSNFLWILSALFLLSSYYFLLKDQLLDTHVMARHRIGGYHFRTILSWIYSQSYCLLAACFIFLKFFQLKKTVALMSLCWFICTLVILLLHRPVWHHYSLFLSVPLCLCAGIGFNEMIQMKKQILASLGLLGIGLVLGGSIPSHLKKYREIHDLTYQEHAPLMECVWFLKNVPTSGPVFTDRPIIAFQAGKCVIPELCVYSLKRFYTGYLNDDYLTEALKKYSPDVLLFYNPVPMNYSKLIHYIHAHYVSSYSPDGSKFFFKRQKTTWKTKISN
ncbi:MAG: glycosyltransferase family 39 protein [Candidatus Aureabacteria bacterium]|nr:glycosyltransferase family 39 protein [Candidatus Auribacterota bacterium]